jgi:tRNA dimethylallyltransferase
MVNVCQHKTPVICLTGPTAAGKTNLAIALTQRVKGEIISADSAMVYRDLNIGTAKPSKEIRAAVPHHLIDICDLTDIYSAGQFCHDTHILINRIHTSGRLAIIAGGTMLYFYLLQHGMSKLPPKDDHIREKLKQEGANIGWSSLYTRLKKIDPITANKVHINDTQRIQRALEIYYITGKPVSQLHQQSVTSSPFEYITVRLLPPSTAILHQRIKHRFDQMLRDGFIHEVEVLYHQAGLHTDLPALRTVGYRQIWHYLEGKYEYQTMYDKTLQATRQLAKHQTTWLKKWTSAAVLTTDTPQDKLIQSIIELLNRA